MPLRIHHEKMFVSGEAWRLFQEAHPEQDFSIFGSRFRLGFLWDASIFLLRNKESSSAANSSSSKIPKMEPLSPIVDKLDFAYASDSAEDNSREPGHVVELSF
jgi:hypothetical protein